MKYRISHNTGYHYSAPASLSQNELLLQPRNTPSQEVLEYNVSIAPRPQYQNSRTDFFGNTVDLFMIQHPHDKLSIAVTSIVETKPPDPVELNSTITWEETARRLKTAQPGSEELEATQFKFESPLVNTDMQIRRYALESFPPDTPLIKGAIDLMSRIYNAFEYDKNASTVDTTVEQVLAERKGVCQDFAHLAISCLRSLGLAARYVSGYLETQPPPGKPRLIGADASHAWFSVFIPDLGWVDLDPTNNQQPGESYITVAWGRDYGDVTPVKGVVMGGGNHQLSVTVDVAPLDEA